MEDCNAEPSEGKMLILVFDVPLASTVAGIPAEIATRVPVFRNFRLEIDIKLLLGVNARFVFVLKMLLLGVQS